MNGTHSDLRGLLYALINPTSNEQYIRDQQTLTELFKQPGMSVFSAFSHVMQQTVYPAARTGLMRTVSEFFITLQGCALDNSLSQPERLLASVITGRELKMKWRSKT